MGTHVVNSRPLALISIALQRPPTRFLMGTGTAITFTLEPVPNFGPGRMPQMFTSRGFAEPAWLRSVAQMKVPLLE